MRLAARRPGPTIRPPPGPQPRSRVDEDLVVGVHALVVEALVGVDERVVDRDVGVGVRVDARPHGGEAR